MTVVEFHHDLLFGARRVMGLPEDIDPGLGFQKTYQRPGQQVQSLVVREGYEFVERHCADPDAGPLQRVDQSRGLGRIACRADEPGAVDDARSEKARLFHRPADAGQEDDDSDGESHTKQHRDGDDAGDLGGDAARPQAIDEALHAGLTAGVKT